MITFLAVLAIAKDLAVVLIPVMAPFIVYWLKSKTKDEKLQEAIEEAVGAAEELAASGAISSKEKPDFVYKKVSSEFPEAKTLEDYESKIASAIHKLGIGAASKIKKEE